jgi:hypothetical protein
MALLSRRPRPPADVLSRLSPDERVVAWAEVDPGDAAAGGAVVATNFGLWWPFAEGPRRIGWELVSKAVWRDGALTVTEAVVDDVLLHDLDPVSVAISQPQNLPPTVRKRVESSVVRSEVALIDEGTALFVGRRVPGQDGVTWWARLEGNTLDNERTRASVHQRIDALAASWKPVD